MFQHYKPVFGQPGIPCGARTVTCRNPNCLSCGTGVEVADDDSVVFCGPCGQEITDCVPIPNSNPAALVPDVTPPLPEVVPAVLPTEIPHH